MAGIEPSHVPLGILACAFDVQRSELEPHRVDDSVANECLRLARATARVCWIDETAAPRKKLPKIRTAARQALPEIVARDAENFSGNDVVQLQYLPEHEADTLNAIEAKQHAERASEPRFLHEHVLFLRSHVSERGILGPFEVVGVAIETMHGVFG